MSLSRQIGLGFFLILLLIFFGSLWLNIQNTRAFVAEQLQSHAQDTATSLGLSITPYIGDENALPIIETMQQAIFDRGYYESIVLKDMQGNVLIEMQHSLENDATPDWFRSLFPLDAPTADTQINDGWNIKGELEVKSSLDLGYEQLYANAKGNFFIFVVAFIITGVFVWQLISKIVSRPLSTVMSQVNDISEQKFDTVDELPRTPEFRSIIVAINKMSTKLSTLFSQITKQSEEYRRFAYVDLLTNAGNRRAFELSLNNMLDDTNTTHQGYLYVIKASSLAHIHKQLGGELGDQYLIQLLETIKNAVLEEHTHFSIYRISGADFALVLEDIEESQARNLASSICQASRRFEKTEHVQGVAHIGLVNYHTGMTMKTLMERVDSALTQALESENRWHLKQEDEVSLSNEEWRAKLNDIIQRDSAEFVRQTVVSTQSKKTVYKEWFARLPDKVNSAGIPMNQLIPASIKLDYAQAIDKVIVTQLLNEAKTSDEHIGLNISRLSLLDPAFSDWLLIILEQNSATCPKLVLEIPERALVQDIRFIKELVLKLKQLGVKIAVEHFGAQLAGIGHLRNIMPDYLKIDGRFIRGIDSQKDNQLFVNSLISIAKGLSIKIIAETVETEAEYQWLADAGVDMLQGYYISPPE